MLLLSEPELRDDQENDSDFFLLHVLTAQGIPRTCFYELRAATTANAPAAAAVPRTDAGAWRNLFPGVASVFAGQGLQVVAFLEAVPG